MRKFIMEWIESKEINQMGKYGIFGASTFGLKVLDFLTKNIGISKDNVVFIDNDINKQGKFLSGIEIKNINDLAIEIDRKIIIASQYYNEIEKQLLNLGVSNYFIMRYEMLEYWNNADKIEELINMVEDEKSIKSIENIIKYRITKDKEYLKEIYEEVHYFPNEIIKLSKNEVMIDGGAYTGDTLKEFIKHTNGNFKKIYSFEPGERTFEELQNTKDNLNDDRIEIFKLGLYSDSERLLFDDTLGAGSTISSCGNSYIDVVSLDKFVEDENVSFIKMDIEGSELEALKGAKSIINKNRPKLAICIYHKINDLWNIPLYIRRLELNYKIYIRHHNDENEWETVCYAVPRY